MFRFILMLTLLLTFSNAKNLTIVVDNDASDAYLDENYVLGKFLKQEHLEKMGIERVYILRDRDKAERFELKEEEVPSQTDLDGDDLGIADALEKVLSKNYGKDDVILFLSTMDYVDKASKTSSKNKVYNDAWLTSTLSPIKRVMDMFPNTPLNKAKVIVIDTSRDLRYLKQRERFFSFLFAKVGGRLLYYGGLDFDSVRIDEYISTSKELHVLTQVPPLRDETHLMLDDKVIQYELP